MYIQTTIEPSGAVMLMLAGTFNGAGVADFERALDLAHQLEQPVFLDLTRITLIDRPTLQYLIDVLRRDVRLVICSPSVEEWLARAQDADEAEDRE
jgi:hypothetical protein